jgi:hypothetical protein
MSIWEVCGEFSRHVHRLGDRSSFCRRVYRRENETSRIGPAIIGGKLAAVLMALLATVYS